jgi:hypothetical protein
MSIFVNLFFMEMYDKFCNFINNYLTSIMHVGNWTESASISYCLQIKYSLIVTLNFKYSHNGDIAIRSNVFVKNLRISRHPAVSV